MIWSRQNLGVPTAQKPIVKLLNDCAYHPVSVDTARTSPAQRRAEALGHMARAAGSPLARSVRTHSVRRSCYSTVGRALDTLIEAQQLATQIKAATRSKIERSVATEVLDLDIGP
jgi:hypothetical protein